MSPPTDAPTDLRTQVDGRTLTLSNLDKVLFPSGFTKAEVISYYVDVAPVMLPHLAGKAITRLRFPNGTDASSFYEKNVPAGAPDWVESIVVAASEGMISYVTARDAATLVWLANLAALELHVPQWRVQDAPATSGTPLPLDGPGSPRSDSVVVDLDPGEGTTMVDTARAALLVANELALDGMVPSVKTSGNKGLQVYAPITPTPGSECVAYVRVLAERLAGRHPDRFVAVMAKAMRTDRIFVDYLQNQAGRNTIAPYSLRGRHSPGVSTPLTWDEVASVTSPDALRFSPADVLARVRTHGDLFADILERDHAAPLPRSEEV
ncbi:MAG TPA: non-homologous end-joining DNA ligase [Propionibacteriaceae bacterium]|nr:non-homologous end-joining DNA ligase [Propionibacteriaceae bacterium]